MFIIAKAKVERSLLFQGLKPLFSQRRPDEPCACAHAVAMTAFCEVVKFNGCACALHGIGNREAAGTAVGLVILGAKDEEGRRLAAHQELGRERMFRAFVEVGWIDEHAEIGATRETVNLILRFIGRRVP